MKFFLTLAALVASASATEAVKSGHAAAELLAASSTYRAAEPVQVAIRLKVDPDWHTYWVNPGEGGMKLGVEWKLPEGWTAGPIGWPVPVRFMTGNLPGFGYHGEVVLPVTLTPPAGASGEAKIAVKLDWLTCSDEACVPGDAEVILTLKEGEPTPAGGAAAIEQARALVPQVLQGLILSVTDAGKDLVLDLKVPGDRDSAKFAVFPATPQMVDAGAKIVFEKKGDSWTATVPKSEYLEGTAKELELVLSGGGLDHPAAVIWRAGESVK